MQEYNRRVVDTQIDMLLSALPAVAIEGPKGVGKTATAERRARTVYRLDDPTQREIAVNDPAILLKAPPPVLIDEWQHAPSTWDAVRRAVDNDASPNRFLLTGSAFSNARPTHSGAGRIVTVRMRPLALSERGLGASTVSLTNLLEGHRLPVSGATDVTLADYTREIVRSGLPGLRHLSGGPLGSQIDSYLERVVQRDVEEQGYRVRKPAQLRRWMEAYAAATAMVANFEKIRDAATSGDGITPARPTADSFREALMQLWLLDPVPGWIPSRNHLSRLTQAQKHHVADPAFAARLLGLGEDALLAGRTGDSRRLPRDGTLLGALFESLVTLSVRVYAQAANAHIHHLRTWDGRREIDLIAERDDHRVLAIEVKLSPTVDDKDVKHLLWLKGELGDDVLDLVVVTTGPCAYRRTDGIAIVPAALLGP
jgi:hypothetical protein